MIIGFSELGHVVERHVANKALDSHSSESALSEAAAKITHAIPSGFPFFGLPIAVIVGIVICLLGLLVLWNLVGKGSGSHAGREEVRRAYRRKLAQEMAKEDAEKIKRGEKPRRRWMQW